MTKREIRPARPQDLPALCALINGAYRGEASRRGWTTEADWLGGQRTDEAALREELARPGTELWVAEAKGALLGCVLVRRKPGHGYIGLLTVRPERQGGGLGRRLLEAAQERIRAQWRLPKAEMCVLNKRDDLIAWYERRGFRRTGVQEPFPYGNERYGLPKVADLCFVVLEKDLRSVF